MVRRRLYWHNRFFRRQYRLQVTATALVDGEGAIRRCHIAAGHILFRITIGSG